MMRDGICMQCCKFFWWTGAADESVPPCDCGRHHTELDFKAMKEIRKQSASLASQGNKFEIAWRKAVNSVRAAYGFFANRDNAHAPRL